MAWPQQPPADPTRPGAAPSATSISVPALIAGISGVLTFLFSFVQIVKIDNAFVDVGASVWTTDFGLFGIGTWIPVFALVAGGVAVARTLAAGLDEREVAGFTLRQVQLVAVAFAVLVWLGYLVNAVLAEELTPALGMFLLFIGLAGVTAGTVMDVLGVGASAQPGAPTEQSPWPSQPGPTVGSPSGQWEAPSQPAPPDQGQWPQQPVGGSAADHAPWQPPTTVPPAPPVPDPGQWQQAPPAAAPPGGPPPAPAPATEQWIADAVPGQWQPDPATGTPAASPGDPQPWSPGPSPAPAPPGPQPEPGPLDPQPAPPQPMPGPAPTGGGALIDPGTQVIPGPPPAPPPDAVDDPADARPPGFPEPPPSNTP